MNERPVAALIASALLIGLLFGLYFLNVSGVGILVIGTVCLIAAIAIVNRLEDR